MVSLLAVRFEPQPAPMPWPLDLLINVQLDLRPIGFNLTLVDSFRPPSAHVTPIAIQSTIPTDPTSAHHFIDLVAASIDPLVGCFLEIHH